MIIEEMLKNQETKIKNTIKKETKSFNEIFDILDYYLFNYNKIENKEEIKQNIENLFYKLLISIDDLKEEMFESCLKGYCNHDYMNRLDLLIRFLPKNVDLSTLVTVKNILEEDFEPTYDL